VIYSDVEPDDDPETQGISLETQPTVGSPTVITIDSSSRSTSSLVVQSEPNASSVIVIASPTPSPVAVEQPEDLLACDLSNEPSLGGTSSLWSEVAAATRKITAAEKAFSFVGSDLGIDDGTLATPPMRSSTPVRSTGCIPPDWDLCQSLAALAEISSEEPARPTPAVEIDFDALRITPADEIDSDALCLTPAVEVDLDAIRLTPPSPFRSPASDVRTTRPIYEDISTDDDDDTTPLLDERDSTAADVEIPLSPSGIRWLPKNIVSWTAC
jgi:hypothetical protein